MTGNRKNKKLNRQKEKKVRLPEKKKKNHRELNDSIDRSPPRVRKSRLIQPKPKEEKTFWAGVWNFLPFGSCASNRNNYANEEENDYISDSSDDSDYQESKKRKGRKRR
mmetsp:Transcript_5202/g.4982  ORF Transcript_5202/g.4982 Transcript_5202/m.4982 type:complete len:109 (-) Transcript_5202:17-343(-)